MKRGVFLDRDGVLNRSSVCEGRPVAPTSLEEFELLPGVVEAISALRDAGFCLVVVTNQPDVGTAKLSQEVVEEMHRTLRSWLPIHDIKVCYHQDEDHCECRKPKPGMLVTAAQEQAIDLNESFMVGDRWRDISAGKSAGCKTIFLDYGYREILPDQPDFVVASLLEASRIIVQS
jgi:D-glycero-D-manno-heptose 1,7-bisphosphate phosphatase